MAAGPPDFPPPARANYALLLLLLAYILSFIDRNVMAVLIGPIREDFAISDVQYSLLHGFAFSMFYIVMGLPIARLADRHSRNWIITAGLMAWSLMTCLCGAARSFAALFVVRIGVGVGEATLSPAAFSMLGDLFPREKLARALAVYSLGITLGGGLAYIVGGMVHEWFSTMPPPVVPFLGEVRPWQMTFIAVGAPGFLLAIFLGLLGEPARRPAFGELHGVEAQPGLDAIGQHLRLHLRAYVAPIGSVAVLGILGYGTMAWYPEFLIRSFDLPRAEAASRFGLMFIIAGSLGALAGGWAVEPLLRRGYQDAPLRIILAVAALWVLPAVLGPLSGSPTMAVWMAAPIVFFLNAHYGVGVAAVQFITPNRMRAQISALMLFVTNLLGLAFGPTAVAMLTDFAFGDDLALRYSLALLPVLVCPLAIGLVVQGLPAYRRAAAGD
ncbi:MFS transporter [Haliea sp. E1-2-M8]|uniref:spinster family MFS transporter n=1 Tax=Haliea sp. E1-2-M8 TaxID=3064706 RepID=UPI00271AE387|nr:MFS transporter [Haliea sp. E1-2-M8]MDO8861295.1 MFS transporter [Haliea sp. E1-2-M8]